MITFRATPVITVPASGAAQTLTFTPDGQPVCYDMTLTAACTLSVTGGIPGIRQFIQLVARTGAGAFALTLPGGVQWHNNAPPTLTVTPNKIIDLVLSTTDGGVTLIAK